MERVLLADDHSLIRRGVQLILKNNLNIEAVGEASNCCEVMSELQKGGYTHIILDLVLTDCMSLEIIPNIQKLYPDLNIMVFSMLCKEIYGEALKQYGVYYYLQKNEDEEETVRCIREFLFDYDSNRYKKRSGESDNPFSSLSARELEVLHYMLKGDGTKEISNSLNLRMSTVSTIKGRIFEKTDTNNLKTLMQLSSLFNINFV
ncbi:MAG: response regulator transcription factor [Flavipsychrobacter sp.]